MSEEIFRIIVTFGVGFVVIGMFVIAMATFSIARAALKIKVKVEALVDRADPILESIRRITDENAPKFTIVADRAVEIAGNARAISEQAKDIGEAAKEQVHIYAEVGRDIAIRATDRIAQVDEAVDETVDRVQHVGANLKEAGAKLKDNVVEGAKVPVREATAIFAGVKAAVGAFARGRVTNADYVTQDEEMFI